MNPKVAFALIFLFISIGCRDVFNILYFYGNQDFIVENFCVNRDKPETLCSGRCYLSKKLDKTPRENNLPVNRLFDHFKIKLLPTQIALEQISTIEVFKQPNWMFKPNRYSSDYLPNCFQPPEINL